jgi:formylglycine-generating enzyme required for sulfatase activity
VVAGGTFTMGSAIGWDDELPTHSVTLATFHLSATEITQAQYTAVTGNNPSYYTGTSRPVEQVTWYDAVEFCNKLSDREGLTPVYTVTSRSPSAGYPITSATVTMNRANNGYRLPTEAEREFAARGGNSTHGYIYAGSNTASFVAWTAENSIGTSHDVATKIANELGIYDLSGNVWEWCWDWYAFDRSAMPSMDPSGPQVGTDRINRGGGWNDDFVDSMRPYFRADDGPDSKDSDLGFRVVRTSLGL